MKEKENNTEPSTAATVDHVRIIEKAHKVVSERLGLRIYGGATPDFDYQVGRLLHMRMEAAYNVVALSDDSEKIASAIVRFEHLNKELIRILSL